MGIALQNLGLAPDQSVFTQDVASATKLLTSDSFAGYLQQEIYERSAFIQSGILAADARLNNVQGVIVEMPFAAPLSYEEEFVNSSSTWGNAGEGRYQLQKTQASTQYAPFVTRGAAFAADDLHTVQTGFDALANIRSQLAQDMNRKITAKILAQLEGIFGGALAAHTVTAAGDLTATDILAAKALLGERGHDMDVLVVHPDVRFHLEDLGMTIFEGTPGGPVNYATQGIGVTQTQIGYFAGCRVIDDSQMPRDAAGNYTSYLMKSGIIRTGSQFPIKIETERNILSLQDAMAVTYNRIDHVIGTSWVAGAYASDPLNTDLSTPGNWIAAYKDTRLIPMVQITSTNTKFTGLTGMIDIAPEDRFEKHPSVVQKGTGDTPLKAPSGAKDGDDGA